MKYLHENGYECLTKENFWDDIKEKYPEEFAHFSKWIDKYKKKVGWDKLIMVREVNTDAERHEDCTELKYHDLPIAMQLGIFFGYISSLGDKLDRRHFIGTREDIPHCIKNHFYYIHIHELVKNIQDETH